MMATSDLARHLGQTRRRWPGNRLGQIEEAHDPRAGRSTACGKAPAGRRCSRPAAPPRECGAPRRRSSPPGPRPCASAPARHCICVSSSSFAGQPPLPLPMQQGQPRRAGLASDRPLDAMPYSSRISTAAAIVVVHFPRLSPTADCVTLLVRTILLEMR